MDIRILNQLLQNTERGRTMSSIMIHYRTQSYDHVKTHFEKYYGLNHCHIVDRYSLKEYPMHVLIKEWKLFANNKKLCHKNAKIFLRRWTQDTTAAIFDMDALHVSKMPVLKTFARVPETFEARTIELGYELKNLTRLLWRAAADFVFPNFRMTHVIRKSFQHLFSPLGLKSSLEEIVCMVNGERDDLQIPCFFAELWQKEKDPLLDCICVFYGEDLVIDGLKGCYNPHHIKKRPLPNCFSHTAKKYIANLLLRYTMFLGKARGFATTHGGQNDFGTMNHIKIIQKNVDVINEFVNIGSC